MTRVRSTPVRLTVSQLAARSRTSVASIKFYLREGLLRSGHLSAKHRAFYDEAHVRRLQVIFALRNVGGLSIQTISGMCRLLDARRPQDVGTVVARTIDALARRQSMRASTKDLSVARAELQRFLRAKNVRVRSHAATLNDLAAALVGLRQTIGPEVGPREMEPYLDAMCALAERDYRANVRLFEDPNAAADAATLAIVFGTVLWEPVLVLLRRLALEHVAAQRWRVR